MWNSWIFRNPRERRRDAIRQTPFPQEWRDCLYQHIEHYTLLTESEAAILHDDLRFFIAEKQWEGAGGATVTDEMKVTIAAQACLLLLGMDERRRTELFPNVETVIVYPSGYRARRRQSNGIVESVEVEEMLGEAWSGDWPVVLSWDSVRRGGEDNHDGHNLVLHEFAHKLDMIHGGADGVPRLSTAAEYEAWAQVMSAAYRRLQYAVWENRDSVLSAYGAGNEAEFFAVATEAFFEKPLQMETDEPALYAALMGYYGQDTAARLRAAQHTEARTQPLPEADEAK